MGNNWTDYPHNDAPWSTFLYLTGQYKSDDFTEFAMNLLNHHPGIISWFFAVHTPPKVIVNFIENPWLLEMIGCDITLPHANVNDNLPEITSEVRAKVFSTEYKLYAMMNNSRFYNLHKRKLDATM